MGFLGIAPYGTDRGTDTAPAGNGTTVVQGIGRGVQFTLAIDGPLSIRDQRTYIELSRIYGQVNTGANMATIVVTSNGITIDSAAGTLNFNPSPDNSFKVSATGGVDSISLNYPTAGGINGTATTPPRSDHSHNTAFELLYHVEYDAVVSGTFAVTSTTGVQAATQSVNVVLPNDGRSYLIKGRAEYSIYGSSAAYLGVSFNGATPGVWVSSNEVNPAFRGAYNWETVTGTGQTITVAAWAKVNTGSGWVGSGQLIAWAEAKPLIAG